MRWRSRIALGLAVAFIAVAPLIFGTFTITLMNYIGIYAFAALGLVLLTGLGGLTSFGQAAFVGIGAYATAWYTAVQGGSPWVGLLLALALTGLVALIARRDDVAARRPFPAAEHHRLGRRDLFRVRQSRCAQPLQRAVRHPADLALARSRSAAPIAIYFFIWALLGARHAALPQPAAFAAGTSHPQPARRHRHGGEPRDRCFRMRLAVFVLAGLLAGISGWLYAHVQRFVNPTPFDIRPGIELLLMALVGGAGHIAGAVVGAASWCCSRTCCRTCCRRSPATAPSSRS